jgi:class 3 adenylate cyclase
MSEDVPAFTARAFRDTWGTGSISARFAPSLRHDASFLAWAARYERLSCARGVGANYWDSIRVGWDVRPLLPSIQCPTLVMHHPGNWDYDCGAASYTATQIPGAVGSIEIPTRDLEIYGPQPDSVLDEIESFLAAGSTRTSGAHDIDRAFAVVAFTDVVESTRTAAELGDRRWSELLAVHDSVAARQISAHRGRLIKRTGDGVLATFDAPARAIRCVQTIGAELHQLGVRMRSGLHAGEVELRDDDIAGIGVHIAARVAAMAGSGEVLVSRTVVDLVAGSGIGFSDRGEHHLKGVPGAWRIFVADA